MKSKLMFFIITTMTVGLFSFDAFQIAPDIKEASSFQKPIPSYAKWGRLAMKETKRKYPQADIIDYLHITRVETPNITTEKFKFWLRDSQHEFGVFVTIQFDSKTEKIIQITFKETDR